MRVEEESNGRRNTTGRLMCGVCLIDTGIGGEGGGGGGGGGERR